MNVLLFDIDGTLISSLGAGKAALESALTELFGLERLRGTVTYSGRTDTAIGTDLLALHGIEPSLANRQKLHEGYLKNLPEALRTREGRVLPGVAGLLDTLAASDDVALGLLTGNIRRGAETKLNHYGLYRYFAFGGFGDELHDRDEVAHAALTATTERLGKTPALEKVWVIGDTPLDVKCARAIGAKVLAVATGLHPLEELADHRPDLLMSDLSDPTPLVERIFSA